MNNKYSLPKDGGLIEVSAPRDIIHRYEKIHTTVYENEYLGVQYVADTIVKAIRTYNEIHCSNEVYEESQPFVLGLTTGRTPLGLYRELVKRHEEGIVSFRNVAVFSLDEFYPIRSTEQQSRNFRIHEDFLNHIDILPENIHIPDGTVPEARISEYCASYDHSVRKIDLMIIGVGEDGQIGFNEPGSYAKSRTRLVQLTHNTRKIQSGAFFGLENRWFPCWATILKMCGTSSARYLVRVALPSLMRSPGKSLALETKSNRSSASSPPPKGCRASSRNCLASTSAA